MDWIDLAIYAVLFILIAVVLIRTLRFKPRAEEKPEAAPVSINKAAAASELSEMLRCKTVSHPDESLDTPEEFEKFEALLHRLYPKLFGICEYEKLSPRALLLRWPGKSADDSVVFMSHFDVVPAEEGEWERPAFEGIIENGEIWGRGALDTKSTLLSALHAAEMRIAEGFVPERDVYFCFGGNEEIMGYGAPSIVDELEKRGVRPAMVLDEGGAIVEDVFPGVSAPCALVGIAEKGSRNIEMSALANGGHSSAPPAKSPLDSLARAVCRIHDHPFKFHITEAAAALFDNLARHSSFLYRMIFANLWLFAPALNLICKKSGGELNALVRTTVAFTMASGSGGANILPSGAKVTMNVRMLSGDNTERVLARMKKLVRDEGIEFKALAGVDPKATSPTDTDGFRAIRRAVSETYPEALTSPYLMIACSDSNHYLRICKNVYRFSGMALSSEEREMIHGKNERIPIDKLASTIEFYYRLLGILQG